MERIRELDAIRGLAALGLVMFHVYPTVFFFGWSCVDLFFVLSGYLITTVILEKLRQGQIPDYILRPPCVTDLASLLSIVIVGRYSGPSLENWLRD
jgi:surface polysaccharide O-acyltransferase-like enzyme